jgi:hypothetical protein
MKNLFRAVLSLSMIITSVSYSAGWSNPGTFTGLVCTTSANCTVTGFTGLNSNTNNFCGGSGYYIELPPETATNFKQIFSILLSSFNTGDPVALYTVSCDGNIPVIGGVSPGTH